MIKLSQKIIEDLKSKVQENDLDVIELKEDETLDLIKLNTSRLSEIYVAWYNLFRKVFKETEEVKEILNKNEPLVKEIVELSCYKFDKSEFSRAMNEDALKNYVNEHYFDIIDFVDLCLEVWDETD